MGSHYFKNKCKIQSPFCNYALNILVNGENLMRSFGDCILKRVTTIFEKSSVSFTKLDTKYLHKMT